MSRPKVNSESQKELDRASESINRLNDQIKQYDPFDGLDKVANAEPQTQISRREAEKSDALYLKPVRSIARTNFKNEKGDHRSFFNEAHKADYDRDWEYVKCVVENKEIIGEDIEVWTNKWGCDPAHFWKVPVNKPVMIPRLLAEQLSRCKYHRLRTENSLTGHNGVGQTYGTIVADHVIQRIDARPVGFGF